LAFVGGVAALQLGVVSGGVAVGTEFAEAVVPSRRVYGMIFFGRWLVVDPTPWHPLEASFVLDVIDG
jgi:phenolic acid decarboxylase